MSNHLYSRNFLFLTFSVIMLSLVVKIDFYIIPHIVMPDKNFSIRINELEKMKVVGYIIAGFLAVIFTDSKLKYHLLVGITLFLVSSLCVLYNIEFLLFPALLLMSASSFYYFLTSLIKILEYFRYEPDLGFTITSMLFVSGSIIGKQLTPLLYSQDISVLILLNIYTCSLIFFFIFFDSNLKNQISFTDTGIKFSDLISYAKLQIISGFITGYIIALMSWRSTIPDIENNAITFDLWMLKKYTSLVILALALPVKFLLTRYSKYLLNLLFLVSLLISFYLFLIYQGKMVLHLSLLTSINISVYGVFICNLSIIADKFKQQSLSTILSLYLTIIATGYYAGIITSDEIINMLGEEGLVKTICCITIIFIFYYSLYFINYKLYRR